MDENFRKKTQIEILIILDSVTFISRRMILFQAMYLAQTQNEFASDSELKVCPQYFPTIPR